MASSSSSSSRSQATSLGEKRWNKFKNQWTKALYTPFLVCLSAGNLHIDDFQNFLAQNVYVLHAFAQAYEKAEECTDHNGAKVLIRNMRERVLKEIKMLASPSQVLEDWGVALPEESTPSSATVKYTNFLLATASGNFRPVPDGKATSFEKTKLPAYTFGAMAPLMRLYALLGKELQKLAGAREGVDPIRKWIDQCSSKNFHEATLRTEELLDKLSVSFTREELHIVDNLYGQAIELETEFFLAHTPVQRTVVPLSREHNPDKQRLVLFSDFDLTCTTQESSVILVGLAITKASESEDSQPEDQSESQLVRMSSADLRREWTKLSNQYTKEYLKCLETVLVPKEGGIFDYKGLLKALEEVSKFDKRANKRVVRSNILKGLHMDDDIKLAGERLILRDGCSNFFHSIVNSKELNTRIHIVSNCWCHRLIKPCFASGGLGSVKIFANEFVYQGKLSTGEILGLVESPSDKIWTFRDTLQECDDDKTNLTVCIGDSVGDLLCLLEADVGIVIDSDNVSLKVVASHFGVSLIPLWEGVIRKQKSTEEGSSDWKGSLSGVLYTVSSWTEIHSFVLGL